jgi:two-component system response regulator YesN
MDYEPDKFAEPSLNIVRNKAYDIFTPALSKLCVDFLLSCRGPSIIGVMNYPAHARPEIRMRLRDCLNQLVALSALFGSITFSIALGQAVMSPGELTESFQNARTMISERIIEETGRLIEGFAPPSGIRDMNLLARYSQAAAHFIDALNLDEAESAAAGLERAAASVPNARGWEYLELVRGAAALFASRLDIENREKALSDFNTQCGQCENIAGLFIKLKALQADHISMAIQRQRNQEGQPIRAAKLYIQKNYEKPISLEQVSDAIGLTPSYFSAVFKKETGEGFARYLSRIRVHEAKGLLRETRLPIHDICKRVGYADIKHFTRTFKSEAGITPGEFRKLYG